MTGGLEQFLAEAALRTPQKDAFRCQGAALTYGTLRAAALDMAATLQACGVARGDRVAIAMTKGLEMPIALHGIWLAGAAFVPLDTSAPVERLAGILETCDIDVVIGAERDHAVLERLSAARSFKLIGAKVAGAETVAPQSAPNDFAPISNTAEDVAYVMFTSGSTGAPKGLVHTHGSGMAFAQMWARLYALGQDDILFCTVPLHFDFCLADFLATPLASATTELVPEIVQRFPASLAEALEKSRATIWSTVPFALIQLRERGGATSRDFTALRWVIFGGEAFSPRHLAAVREVIGAEFSNSYGPAEVNQVTEYTVPTSHEAQMPIPIGHAMDHARLAISDDGELLVGGQMCMRGYWGQDDLNARAFVEQHGQRFYRTGDRVSVGEDGLCRRQRFTAINEPAQRRKITTLRCTPLNYLEDRTGNRAPNSRS